MKTIEISEVTYDQLQKMIDSNKAVATMEQAIGLLLFEHYVASKKTQNAEA